MIPRYTPKDLAELWSDENKFGTWLRVELAVLKARECRGEIPRGTADEVSRRAVFTVSGIEEREREIEHDLLSFVEVVRRSLGELAAYFHEGMTSYDVVDTAQALLLKQAGQLISDRVQRLLEVLKLLAKKHARTLMVGRTHGVHGEPITFGFLVLNWYDQVSRAGDLLEDAFNGVKVGRCAGAMGTYFLRPEIEEGVCQELGLNQPVITTQIAPRLLHANLLSAIAILGSVLDKICQDIRNMQRTEVGELEEPRKERQKGSSAMPHKKNPVICERICGLARDLRACASVGFEDIVTWDLRDITQSSAERIALVDAIILIAYMLDKMTWVIEGLIVQQERMRQNLELTQGVIYSQDVKLLLAERARDYVTKLSPEAVYEYVQQCAFAAVAKGEPLLHVLEDTLLPNQRPVTSLVTLQEIEAVMSPWWKLRFLPQVFQRFGIVMEVPDA